MFVKRVMNIFPDHWWGISRNKQLVIRGRSVYTVCVVVIVVVSALNTVL